MPEAGRATVKFVGDYSALMAGLTSSLAPGKMKSVGMKAGLALGGAFAVAGVTKGLTDAVRVTKEFDKQISSLGAVAGATEKQMDRLRRQAIKLGGDTVFSATEAAQAQTELAKGGLNASQILSGALKSSLDLAAAGEMDLAAAAETTVNAMQLFELQGKSTGKIADMLATAANRTTADVEDFAMSLKMGGSVAKQAGYDLNDTVVVLEALAEAGIKNSDAGTSMKAAMIQLLNPTAKQSKLAKELGVNWITQNGELKNGIQISKELQRATADMTKAERTKAFAVLAGTDGFRTLSSLYDAGVGTLRRYARANREQGTAAEVAAKKTDNLAGDTEQLSGAWETFQITIGTKVTPILRDLTQAATDAVTEVTKIFNDKNLSGGEKFQKIIELAIEAGIKGFEKLTAAAVKAAPRVAEAFAKGFASAPIWMQLGGAALMLRMFGGAAGVASAGTKVGGMFMAAFSSVTQTYSLARSFGYGRGSSAYAGIGALATPMMSSLFSSISRVIAPVAATYAIGDVISTVIAGDTEKALQKASGALVGAGVGFLVGGPVGAAIGAGVGTGLSGVLGSVFDSVFSSNLSEAVAAIPPIKRLEKQVRSLAGARAASNRVVARTTERVLNLQGRLMGSNRRVARAEEELTRARRKYGKGSVPAIRAEQKLNEEKRKNLRLTNRLNSADRLRGAVRAAQQKITAAEILANRKLVRVKRQDVREDMQAVRVAGEKGAGYKVLKPLIERLNGSSRELNKAQKRSNETMIEAESKIGPRWVKRIKGMNDAQLRNVSRSKLSAKAHRVAADAVEGNTKANKALLRQLVNGGPKADEATEALADQIADMSTTGRKNWRGLLSVQRKSTEGMTSDAQEQMEVIQNLGTPQAKRKGGVIEWMRQRFRGGGVPVAVSPGEMFKTPDGKTGVVPGKPTAADNVLTSMPVGTKVFTFDGQRRLAEGASEGEALRSQLPHFAGGGIVKPEISGGSPKGRELGNTAISRIHEKAAAKLKRAKSLASRSRAGGSWSGGSGQYPGVSGDTDFMPALGNALSAMSKAAGTSISVQSGWRSYAEQAALYQAYLNGTGNLAAPPGSSNHESGRAADITPGSEVFGSLAGRFGMGFTVPGESWHIELLRRGGIVGLLQSLYTGGQVNVVKNVGKFLMQRGFDHRATAGILGNAYREGLWNPAQLEYGNSSNGGLYGFTTSPVSLADMQAFAASRGKPWDDEIVQTNFMLSHGNPPGIQLKGLLNANETIAESAEDFMSKWERPASATAGLSERIKAGHDASKILRDAGINGSSQDSGPTAAEKAKAARKARRQNREKQVRELIQKAFASKSPQGKKGNLWQILSMYAKYGDFGAGKGGMLGGGVAPGGKFSEAEEFLRRVGGIASLTDPNRGSGQLYGLVKWLQGNVEMTGSDDENDSLFNKLERVKDKGGTRAEKKRNKIFNRIKDRGTDYPNKGRLFKNDRIIRTVDEWIELAQRDHASDGSAGGSDYTDSEVDYEKRLNKSLLGSLFDRKRMLAGSMKYVGNRESELAESLKLASKSGSPLAWKRSAFRDGLSSARSTLSNLRQNWEELVGLTGRGGKIGEVKATLKDLGFTDTVEKSSAAARDSAMLDIMREQLGLANRNNAILAAQLPVFQQFMPKYHTGGVVPGVGERPAMVMGGEGIFTRDQMAAMGGGSPTVVIEIAPGAGVDPNMIDARIDGRLVKAVRKVRTGGPAAGRSYVTNG